MTDPSRDPDADASADASADLGAEQWWVADLARSLCAGLDPDVDPLAPVVRPGPGRLTLEAVVTVVVREHPDGRGSLARLAEALVGWRRRVVPGRVARLEARLGPRAVAASYVEDERVLVLTVVSAPVVVTREQSRRLRGAA